MTITLVDKEPLYVLNQCARYLARDNRDERHNFGQFPAGDPRARIAESWRFPIVDGYGDGPSPEENYKKNTVTFVYTRLDAPPPSQVSVVGTFGDLYAPVGMRRVGDTDYFSVSVAVPKGEVHLYKYMVDGEAVPDPINPQRVVLDSGKTWLRFFTQLCYQPIALERWEMALLRRLTEEILPLRTKLGQKFLTVPGTAGQAHLLDESVGAHNYIDKLLAREESHRLVDYRICLAMIARLLAARSPGVAPEDAPGAAYAELFTQMKDSDEGNRGVPGWDHGLYGSPRFFLQLLRRHTITGAFCHPKYGGNVGAAGWAYLGEQYRKDDKTLFDWKQVMEWPLGENRAYLGVPGGGKGGSPT